MPAAAAEGVRDEPGRTATESDSDFTSLEDEAAFWDSHSLGEFEDELEPVEAEVARLLVHRLTVDLEWERFRLLAAIAKQQGLGPTALARRWVLDNLERAESEQDHAQSPGSPRV